MMKEQLLETWDIHQRMNNLVIENTTETGMQRSMSTRGGRTIYLQWTHIHNVRMNWLEVCAKDIFKKYKVIDKADRLDRETLLRSLDESATGIRELLGRGWDDGGKIKGYKKGVVTLLGYLISHESHHRGNILLTLKLTGEKIPDVVKWGIWEWDR